MADERKRFNITTPFRLAPNYLMYVNCGGVDGRAIVKSLNPDSNPFDVLFVIHHSVEPNSRGSQVAAKLRTGQTAIVGRSHRALIKWTRDWSFRRWPGATGRRAGLEAEDKRPALRPAQIRLK